MDGQTKWKEGGQIEGEINILRVIRLLIIKVRKLYLIYFLPQTTLLKSLSNLFVFFGSIMIEFPLKHYSLSCLSYFLTSTVTAINTRLNLPQVWAKLHTNFLLTEKY